jgi:hypothetical protein
MKQAIVKAMAILLIGMAVTNSARTQPDAPLQMAVSQPDSNELKFDVKVSNPEKKRVSVTVSQRHVGVLYSNSFTDQNYGARYNMAELEDGQYSIEVSAGSKRIVKDITINTVVEVNRIASINSEKVQGGKKKLGF